MSDAEDGLGTKSQLDGQSTNSRVSSVNMKLGSLLL